MYLKEEESLLLQMYTFVPVKNTMTYQENEEDWGEDLGEEVQEED